MVRDGGWLLHTIRAVALEMGTCSSYAVDLCQLLCYSTFSARDRAPCRLLQRMIYPVFKKHTEPDGNAADVVPNDSADGAKYLVR